MKVELGQWSKLLAPFRRLFTEPGANRFVELLTAWVLCPGRRTGTRLWQMVAGADRPGMRPIWHFAVKADGPNGPTCWESGRICW